MLVIEIINSERRISVYYFDCCIHRQFVFTIRAVPFWNKLPAEIFSASSVKSFKTLLDAHWQSLFPEVPT